jgi:hypothetical protein
VFEKVLMIFLYRNFLQMTSDPVIRALQRPAA